MRKYQVITRNETGINILFASEKERMARFAASEYAKATPGKVFEVQKYVGFSGYKSVGRFSI